MKISRLLLAFSIIFFLNLPLFAQANSESGENGEATENVENLENEENSEKVAERQGELEEESIKESEEESRSFKLFSISITPEIGIMNGMIYEYVFEETCTNTDHLESQLDWQVKNIPIISLDCNFDIFKYVRLEISGIAGIPKSSGYMEDSDWLNFIYWPDDSPTERTHYSKQDNKLLDYYKFGASLGGNIILPKLKTTITPLINYTYEHISFDGTGGLFKYKSNNYQTYSNPGQKVISYQQDYSSISLGFSASFDLIPYTSIQLSFLISPKLTDISAYDWHWTNRSTIDYDSEKMTLIFRNPSGTLFYDHIQDTWNTDLKAAAYFAFNKYHKLGLSYRLGYAPLSKGLDYARAIDASGKISAGKPSPTAGVEGGAKKFLWSLSLSYQFNY